MRLRIPKRWHDLLVVVIYTVAVCLWVYFTRSGSPFWALLLLVIPGYVTSVTLYPLRGEIDFAERLGLSLALSIALTPLLVLPLGFLPWGITRDSTVATLSAFNLAMSALAIFRRRRISLD